MTGGPAAPAARLRGALTLLPALALAAAFVGVAQRWDAASPGIFFWGDSYPNGLQALWELQKLDEGGLLPTLLSSDFYDTGARAPGLYVLQSLVWWTFGLGHTSLLLSQQLQLAAAGLLLFGVVRRLSGSMLAGLVAELLIFASPEALGQAQNFQLETPSLLFTALALYSAQGIAEGRPWGGPGLGLALGMGLLFRQQLGAALILPAVVASAWPALRSLARGPLIRLPLLLSLPAGAVLAAFILGPGDGGPLRYHPLITALTLAAAAGIVHLLRRGGGAPDPGLELALALALGAALSMPWYFSHLEELAYHLDHSSTATHSNLAAAPRLIAFQYRVLVARGISLSAAPLLAGGVAWALLKVRQLVPRWCLAGLLCANLCFPLYFHARYSFPLLAFAAALCAAWLPALGRARVPVIGAVAALALVRLGGWMLPLPVAAFDLEDLASEMVSWHQASPSGAPEARSYPGLLAEPLAYTVAPSAQPDWMDAALSRAEAACPRRVCTLYFNAPPPGFEPAQQLEDITAAQYHLAVYHPRPRLTASPWVGEAGATLAVPVFRNAYQARGWTQSHAPLQWTVLERVEPFGNMFALVLSLRAGAPTSAGAPPTFSWHDHPELTNPLWDR